MFQEPECYLRTGYKNLKNIDSINYKNISSTSISKRCYTLHDKILKKYFVYLNYFSKTISTNRTY